jgi:hypothetical protein
VWRRDAGERGEFIGTSTLVWEYPNMNPQDDPEARIRELERPLEDVAREIGANTTSEQSTAQYSTAQYDTAQYDTNQYGTGQYAGGQYGATPYDSGQNSGGYPQTTPWPAGNSPYGTQSPYQTQSQSPYTAPHGSLPQQPKSGGFRPWMLALGVAVLGLLAIGGAFAFIGFNMTSFDNQIASDPDGDNPSGVLGGGGPVDKPSVSISVPTAVPANPDIVNPPAGSQVNIAGVGQNKTIACNDGFISISGVSNTITITGHCADVTVSGMQNVIVVDNSDNISASGVDNKVTFRTGAPKVENSGFDNIVEQG